MIVALTLTSPLILVDINRHHVDPLSIYSKVISKHFNSFLGFTSVVDNSEKYLTHLFLILIFIKLKLLKGTFNAPVSHLTKSE